LGRNFVDPIPSDNNPTGVGVREDLAGVSTISKSQATTILSGVSSTELDPYVEYVHRLVPRASCSTSKRARADDTSISASVVKKPHQPSTLLGSQVVGSMLLD
jgi:hypothetical protein